MKNLDTDRKIVFLMMFTWVAPFFHALLRGYFPAGKSFLGFLIAAVTAFAVHYAGFFFNYLIAKKPEYDKEKSFGEYIDKKKMFPDVLMALGCAVICFFVAFAMKRWFIAETPHPTEPIPKGYLYEIMYAVLGFVAALVDGLLWFIPDDIFLPNEESWVYWVLPPICLFLIPVVIFSGEFKISLIFVVLYFVLLYIRGINRNKLERERKEKEEAEAPSHKGRFDY